MAIKKVYELSVDLKKTTTRVNVPVLVQGDSAEFRIRLLDNGAELSTGELNGITAVKMQSGYDAQTVIQTVGTLQGSVAVFRLQKGELFRSGTVQAMVQLEDSADRISTLRFQYQVIEDLTGNYIPGEQDLTIFQRYMNEAQAKIDEMAATDVAQLTVKLADKVGGERKAELEDLSPTVLGAIEGGEGTNFNLLSIPQDKSVTEEKTTFIETSTNLANTNDMLAGYDLDVSNGNAVRLDGYFTSVFIKLVKGETYRSTNFRRRAIYDKDNNFISGLHGNGTFVFPQNAEYLRFSSATPETAQLNKGSATLPYQPFFKPKFSKNIDLGLPAPEVVKPNYFNPKARPVVSITFDDGNLSDYTRVFPELLKRGMRGVFGVVPGSWIGAEGMATASQLKEMSDNGMSIISHTNTHPQLTSLTREQAVAEFRESKNAIEAITGRPCNTLLVPYNLWNDNLAKWSKPFFDCVRVRSDTIHPYGTAINPHYLRSFGIESNTTLDEAKRVVDLAIESTGWVILMFHKIMDTDATEFHWDMPRFTALLDYIESKDVDVVDLAEGVNRNRAYQGILSDNLIVNPQFKVTSNGRVKPFDIETEGETGAVSYADGKLVITRASTESYITNVRNITMYLEKGATYEFTCEVEINATTFRDAGSGVLIGEQLSGKYSSILRENGVHQLRVEFIAAGEVSRPDFRVLKSAGIFKFEKPKVKRIK